MTRASVRIATLLCSALVLFACAGAKTPQEVTTAFWESVIGNDVKRAVQYSTLTDADQYDGFARDWSGLTPSLGKVVIEGEEARIVTKFSRAANAGSGDLSFTTFLVRRNDEWLVDYARTAQDLGGGPLGKLFGQLKRIGESLTSQLSATSDKLSVEMEGLGAQLEELSGALSAQAADSINKYGEELRRSIDALAESARRALKEHERQLSDQDRRALQGVVANLEEGSEKLSDPTFQAVADSQETMQAAQQQLEAITNDTIRPLKEQWQAWGERFEGDMQKMVDELSALANRSERN